jgi:hypothetical protein
MPVPVPNDTFLTTVKDCGPPGTIVYRPCVAVSIEIKVNLMLPALHIFNDLPVPPCPGEVISPA